MAKKATKKKAAPARPQLGDNVEILSAGEVIESPITDTLETNYMPYAMSVIVSRALPEIDGFKPAHRKLLYTMYGMGLLKGARTKSANIVGSTMHLNPHGDAAIYDTMVRMGRSNESLLVPFVDSKGNFGKAYSRDMAYAAARYTEAKLEPVCEELFRDIDKDTVDFVPNYDGTTTEPTMLPVTFPTILANNTLGIAVGMASNICSFNLVELCNATIALMKDDQADLAQLMPAPDFVGGGSILYDAAEMQNVLEKGRGSIRVRAKWAYDKENNCIDITRIPPTTTVEAIMDKITELVKLGKIREISDMRDETDLNGLKLTIDLKRGQDPDKLMARLFKATPLEDSFACNFNVLIGGQPRVLGVRQILLEWIAFRSECVRRRTYYDLQGKQKRLHLLRGLEAILLDIDKAIEIVRNTAEESEVVPNLMIGFGIDEVQAEYVAEIKLRHLNREYILKRTEEIEELEKAIADLEDVLQRPARIRKIIMTELGDVAKKYGSPRKTEILYDLPDDSAADEQNEIPDYPVTVFFTREGYFKKITPQSLRMSGEQKLKDGDEVVYTKETTNSAELLFFTNHAQVYKSRASEFADTKASVLGDYVASKLEMEEGEVPLFMTVTVDYRGYMLFFYQNGKCAKIPLEDSFACNFNVLIGGQPRVLGVRQILLEWIAFRSECVRRRTYYDLQGKQKRLHLLRGLEAILLDIDKAIEIVRNTAEESEVVPNLMIGFGIDEVQAEYVAEIKLRHLNREYILKRTEEIEELEKAIADLEDVLQRPARIRKIIMTELGDVAKKYGSPRKTEILYDLPDDSAADEQNEIPDYPVTVFFTREGYFKKITPQSLRMSGEQKLKDGDEVVYTKETTNSAELLFFTNHAQVYKSRASEFADTKASVLGDYVASKLEMEEGEVPLFMTVTVDYRGYMLFFYQNGKCAKIPLASYMTKQNRRKLLKAYSDKEELAAMLHIEEETELAVFTSGGTGGPRLILVGSALIPEKATRDTAGINMVTLKKNARIAKVRLAAGLELKDPHRYRVRTLPAAGALLRQEDTTEQMSL